MAVTSKAEWVIYNDIFVDGEYDAPIQAFIDQWQTEHQNSAEKNAPLVLDLGANVGFFMMRFAHLWKEAHGNDNQAQFQCVGVEGAPDVYDDLNARLVANKLDTQCTTHYGLAGERSGSARITRSDFHVTNSIMGAQSRSAIDVPFIDIERILPETGNIDFMKCDIEGAEELFIDTYPELLKRVQHLVIELHHDKCDVEKCIQKLNQAGLTPHSQLRNCLPDFTVDYFVRQT